MNMKKNNQWVEINYENCPTLKKHGCKPFKIMKYKMRDSKGEVWNNINFKEAQKETKKLGYRLPDIREILALFDHYVNTRSPISVYDKEFLGIEELAYDEDVYLELIEGASQAFLRGGYWPYTSAAGVFALILSGAPSIQYNSLGFRCASDHVRR